MRKIDMINKRFGMMLVKAEDGYDKHKQIMYKCLCDCSKEKTVRGVDLRQGKIKSCGCLVYSSGDISGKQYGKLTAIKRVYSNSIKRKNSKSARWLCKCECGKSIVVLANRLNSGHVTSCGKCCFPKYEFNGATVVGHCLNNTQFTIDSGDYHLIMRYPWWFNESTGYFVTTISRRTTLLHQLLNKGKVVRMWDHKDRDPSNNVRANLRPATDHQNCCNKSISEHSITGYIGVLHLKNVDRYCAKLCSEGNHYYLGTYDDAVSAAMVRDRAAIYYHGEFANLNFPRETYGTESDAQTEAAQQAQSKRNALKRNRLYVGQSGYVGVVYRKNRNHYMASLIVAGEYIYIGSYRDPLAAAIARDKVAIKHHGEYADLNFPIENYPEELAASQIAI
jgi:hypothetical protein